MDISILISVRNGPIRRCFVAKNSLFVLISIEYITFIPKSNVYCD